MKIILIFIKLLYFTLHNSTLKYGEKRLSNIKNLT
jgi:hypothetical protein